MQELTLFLGSRLEIGDASVHMGVERELIEAMHTRLLWVYE